MLAYFMLGPMLYRICKSQRSPTRKSKSIFKIAWLTSVDMDNRECGNGEDFESGEQE